MNTTVKNIAKTTSSSFADSKWNDTVVFNSNSKVGGQLEGYTEIQYNNVLKKALTSLYISQAVEELQKSIQQLFLCA